MRTMQDIVPPRVAFRKKDNLIVAGIAKRTQCCPLAKLTQSSLFTGGNSFALPAPKNPPSWESAPKCKDQSPLQGPVAGIWCVFGFGPEQIYRAELARSGVLHRPLHPWLSGADMMNMTRASHRSSVDGNGQVRRVDQRRSVPIGVRRRGQTTATKLSRPRRIVDLRSEAARMIELICELFPLCRSITGDGLRQSLFRLGELIPLETHEVASGTQVFDWTIPKEWNIQDAYIKDAEGRRVVDFRINNLHVVNYSGPVNARMSLGELRPHLHSLPRASRLDPLSHHVLRGLLGLLPVAPTARKPC